MLDRFKSIFYFFLLFNILTVFAANCKYISVFDNKNHILALNDANSPNLDNQSVGINPFIGIPSNNLLDIRNDLENFSPPLNHAKNIDTTNKNVHFNKKSDNDINNATEKIVDLKLDNKNNATGKIVDLKLDNKNGNVSLAFYVTKDFCTQVKVMNFPFRIIFDVPMPYIWDVSNDKLDHSSLSKILSSIKYGNPDDKTFRVMTNLRFPINIYSAYFINNNNESDYKFVINFKEADILTNLLNTSTTVLPQDHMYYSILEENATKNSCKNIENKRKLAVNKWISSYLKDIDYPPPIIQGTQDGVDKVIVVIDPGHGGKDPGAINSLNNSVREKDIVLSISNMIANNLLKNPNISVILTRRGDYFVPLKDRILWAKNFNADLFVSIHADRAPNPDSSGLSVYTLSQNASDAQTQVIAANENKSDIIAGLNNEEDTEVSKILINLLQRLKINDSVTLAQYVLSSTSENVKLLPNPLRSAGFVVLQVPEIPSILIETGFLSNEKDTKNLVTQEYQRLVSEKISAGIENYLRNSGKIS